ncbi:flavodoxin [Curtobacterium sp. PhB115]|nr:flavodoxin [Curtobacterium sp. PhB115]
MPSTDSDERILLAYFSRPGENYWNGGRRTLDTGNTEVLAGLISDRIDCDVVRIEPADPYSDSYDDTVARNVREQNGDARPDIAGGLPDLAQYDTVLLGSPIWNVQPPMIMATFAEAVDLSGKPVLPFVTYAVSGLGSTESFYRDLDTGATLGEGLAVRGEEVRDSGAGTDVDQWLRAAGLL